MYIDLYPTPDPPRRKPLRLPNHDYSQRGLYFVTICTHQKKCLLGSIDDRNLRLSVAGEIASEMWRALPDRIPGLTLDAFVVMPNHLHGVLALVGAGLAPPDVSRSNISTAGHSRRYSLPDVVGAFKSISTIEVNRRLKRKGTSLWQRGYYEHILRDGDDMKNVQRYILENPWKWPWDAENPASLTG